MAMKGGVGWGMFGAKRRWRWFVIGVLALVLLSMLVPLFFLSGFHTTGYVSEHRNSPSIGLENIDRKYASNIRGQSEDVIKNFEEKTKNKTSSRGAVQSSQQTKGSSVTADALKPLTTVKNTTISGTVVVTQSLKVAVVESENLCELRYGGYCLWREQHREKMQDNMVKKLKDQLFVARAYYPSVAKLPAHDKLTRELKLNIQDLERILSESTTDADLPPQIEKKSQKMEGVIARSKSLIVDCNNVDKKLRQLVDLTEDEANFHMKQSAFLYQIAVETVPKSHHCLSMRLTVEYFTSPSHEDNEVLLAAKYMDPSMQHYVILSNNVLASSVVINSTVMHSKESGKLIFHMLTDGHNYFAMKLWFLRNTYKNSIVEVFNIEDKEAQHLSLSEEFRVSFRSNPSTTQIKTDYLSVFSHSHFILPEIFHNLNRVIVLDDDVIVQEDLSALWSLNMEGKAVGAVRYCNVKLGQLKSFFGENNSCAWMSGLNVIDLVRWRDQNLTGIYQRLSKENRERGLSGTSTLLGSLLAMQNQIYSLNKSWVLSGLGHDYSLNINSLKNAAVLHYNGKMKPWLDMGIPKYRNYWNKFLNQDDPYLSQCNINP